MKYISLIVSITFFCSVLWAQEKKGEPLTFSKNSSAKSVRIDQLLGKIVIKQSESDAFKVEVLNYEKPDKRAEGLTPIFNNNVDNTGLGLEMKEAGDKLLIYGASPQSKEAHYTIFVPKQMAITVDYSSPMAHDDVEVHGLKSAVDVKTLSADIKFTDLSGPVMFHSISGDIEGSFSVVNQKNPTSVSAISGDIDIALPGNTPAALALKTISGEIYTNFDITFEKKTMKDERADELDIIQSGIGGTTKGMINNGGVKISMESISGNVYLRKK